jgi:iron complex outermembrane receptor protein
VNLLLHGGCGLLEFKVSIRFQKLPIVCLLAASPALAQEELAFYALPPVFVSSTHTAVSEKDQPFSTTVITAEQIRQSGYTTVRDVLSKLALVNVRTPLDGSRSASVDLRGFGETASANVVFVVDGVKLNDNEGVTPRYGSIPVSSIETIEVIRGGSSVAYGSGASGGVIRITTKKGRGREGFGGDVFASYGSYDTKELGATLYGGANGFSLVFNGSKEFTNGYRDNSEASRDLGSLALDWQGDVYSAGASFSAEGSKSRFPGSLNRAQFEQNPKQTNSPNDFGSFERNTFRFYGEADYGNWGTGVRVSRRTHEALGSFDFGTFVFDARSEYEQDQISPYLTFTLPHGTGAHVIRVGYDIEKAALRGFDAGTLESNAIFIEDDWTVNDVLRINAGSRYERSEQQKASGQTRDYSLVAHQLGASWKATEDLTLFSKLARSFRIPNANENGFAGVGTTRVPFLNPQIADEFEVGLKTGLWNGEFSSALFVMDVENELFFDPTIVLPPTINGLNSNLDELRRQGAELKWNGTLRKDLRMIAAYQYLDAEFKSGSLSGGRVPLVAAHNLKVATEYDWTSSVSTEAILNIQSDQRSAANTDLQIPGFGVLDLNWRYRADSYSVVFQVQNVLDKQYYRTQFGPNGIYPEIGRAFFVNLNAEF